MIKIKIEFDVPDTMPAGSLPSLIDQIAEGLQPTLVKFSFGQRVNKIELVRNDQ